LHLSAAAVVARQEDRAASAAAASAPLLLQAEAANGLSVGSLEAVVRATPSFDSIESALEAIAQGQPVVVLDDEDRENEGDLIIAAEKVLLCSAGAASGGSARKVSFKSCIPAGCLQGHTMRM
jgi:hypothetical protein